MNLETKIKKLEDRKAASSDFLVRVFFTTEDGGAWTSDAAGNRTHYTAAEYAELMKQSEARGVKVINVIPASKDMDGDE